MVWSRRKRVCERSAKCGVVASDGGIGGGRWDGMVVVVGLRDVECVWNLWYDVVGKRRLESWGIGA